LYEVRVDKVEAVTGKPVIGLPPLLWLKAFESAARTMSFAAAAAELNLSTGAISYQIRARSASRFCTFRANAAGDQAHPPGARLHARRAKGVR
jgi:hypothetical protein